MNKSITTNLLALIIFVVGLIFDKFWFGYYLSNAGIFALSGAFTNWLAVYMLFERIPFLYGSGVVPNKFESFKKGIKNLIFTQFFTKENVNRFIKNPTTKKIDLKPTISQLDFNPVFEALTQTVLESPFGQMIQMLGGVESLNTLKTPFINRIKETIIEITSHDEFQQKLKTGIIEMDENILQKINFIVEKRLNELTPQIVKEIIQAMIKKHLGWLVVWGGVFGGLIGLIFSIFKV